jgi:hypothetical protein
VQPRTDHPVSGTDSFKEADRLTPIERFDEYLQRDLIFSAHDRIGQPLEQIFRIDRGVESIETDVAGWVQCSDQLGDPHPKPERRVHRYRDADKSRKPEGRFIDVLHSDIETDRRKPGLLEKSHRLSDTKRLVTQLIT